MVEETEEMVDNETLDVVYTKSDNYETRFASGAHGGVQPEGEFKMDFFVTHNPEVIQSKHQRSPTGVGETLDYESENYLRREKEVGVITTQNNAYTIGIWIISQLLGEDVSNSEVSKAIEKEFPEYFE